MKPIHALPLTFLALAACAGAPVAPTPAVPPPQALAEALEGFGLRADLGADYAVSEQSESMQEKVRVRNLAARAADGRTFKLQKFEGVALDQAEGIIKDRLFQLDTIYRPKREPYFSTLTQQTSCPKRFQPILEPLRKGGGELQVAQLFANDRLAYGACTGEQAVYRAIVGFLRCPGHGGVFVIESFVPVRLFREEDAQAVRSMKCR